MNNTTELFAKAFMLTGQNIDPRHLDFTFYAQEKITWNPDNTPASKEYYMSYDAEAGAFSDLAVKCTYSYETSPAAVRTENIEWYFEDGEVGITRQLVQVQQ
jgi:hypothetical protein